MSFVKGRGGEGRRKFGKKRRRKKGKKKGGDIDWQAISLLMFSSFCVGLRRGRKRGENHFGGEGGGEKKGKSR